MRALPSALVALFVLSLGSGAAAVPAASAGLPGGASLLEPASSLLPTAARRLRLAPELSVRLQEQARRLAQELAVDELPGTALLDDGGGAGGDDKIFGFILGFFPGFGLGHLILDDGDGFIFYLIVDFAVAGAYVLLNALLYTSNVAWAIFVIGWIGIHVMQGLDAYRRGGGRGLSGLPEPPPPERFAARPPDRGLPVALPGGALAEGGGHVLGFSF